MSKYEVVEKFVSINGEGTKAGQLAVFIRFKGCNLNCKYCDTKWANEQGLHKENVTFTMDYKLSCSGMEAAMNLDNFDILNSNDTVKFVAGCREDLIKAKQIIEKYNLYGKCNLYISPVFGMIEPEEIVNFMKENVMNDVNMQIQLHKIIWSPDKKGV